MPKNIQCNAKMRPQRVGIASFAIGALAAIVSVGAIGCPSSNAIGNFVPSTRVQASAELVGVTETYFFTSDVLVPSLTGVPGLIEFCVYTSALPTLANITVGPDAKGANGSAWQKTRKSQQGYFSFNRPNGNPTNIPFDNQLKNMGSATWSGGPTAERTLLLHINDAAECNTLYGGNPGTCWVYPEPLAACEWPDITQDPPDCWCELYPNNVECGEV